MSVHLKCSFYICVYKGDKVNGDIIIKIQTFTTLPKISSFSVKSDR